MSQMKPYCFKCGAELDPEAIYCPECGRLQRSMVVRAVDPGTAGAPPHPEQTPERPHEFYPDRQAPQAEANADQSYYYPEDAHQQPDQHDPYAEPQYSEQSWQAGEQTEQNAWADTGQQAGDQVYAQDEYREQGQDSYYQQSSETTYHQAEAEYDPPAYEPRTYDSTAPAEPVYSSAVPLPTNRYAESYTSAPANPYVPAPYQTDYAPRRSGPSPLRLVALGVGALLVLFVIGYGIGQLFRGGSGSPTSSTNAPQQTIRPTTAPSTAPTAAPTPTTAPTPTPNAGVTGAAKFVKQQVTIPGGKCTTAQGCPVQVNLKNNGDTGTGTVTVTLTDDNNNSVATFTGPIPSTDAGQTVQVTGYANSDQLPAYLRSGGIVHITTVDIQDGG